MSFVTVSTTDTFFAPRQVSQTVCETILGHNWRLPIKYCINWACRDFCQLSDTCNYFSWGKQSRVCLAFVKCDERIDGQEDFITGSRECANEEFSDTSFFQRFSRKIRIGWHIFTSKMKKIFHKWNKTSIAY